MRSTRPRSRRCKRTKGKVLAKPALGFEVAPGHGEMLGLKEALLNDRSIPAPAQ